MASKCGFAMAGIGGRAYFPHPEGLANPYLKAHDIGWPNPWQPYWQRLRPRQGPGLVLYREIRPEFSPEFLLSCFLFHIHRPLLQRRYLKTR
jgi:hypothetical protein